MGLIGAQLRGHLGDERIGQFLSPTVLPHGQMSFTNASARNIADLQGTQVVGPFAGGTLATVKIGGREYGQYETARKNEFTRSNDLSHGDWATNNMGASAAATDPLGGSTARKLKPDGGADDHYIEQTWTPDGSSVYSFGAIAKAAEYTWMRLTVDTAGFPDNPGCYYDLGTGAKGTATDTDTSGIEDLGGGWYWCWFTATSDAAAATDATVWVAEGDGDITFVGDSAKGIIVYNPQLEIGVWPSSPIVTAAAAVTRAKDQASYAAAAVPLWVRSKRHCIYWVPNAASTDTRATQYLYHFKDTGGRAILVYVWTNDKIRVVRDNGAPTEIAVTAAMTWARGQLIKIIIDPALGTLEADCTGGTRTTGAKWDDWLPSTSTLYYGEASDASGQVDALLSEPERC